RVARVEDPRLLAGVGRFVDDITPAGCLHLALRRSDQPHARINGLDVGAAFEVPGVAAIFEAADLDGAYTPAIPRSRMAGYHATPIHPLAVGKVRFVGEPVAAVLADSRYAAEDALEQVRVDYQPLPFEIRAEAAAADGAPRLHEEAPSNVIVERAFSRGDVDEAFAQAAAVVGGRFRMHRKSPTAMENRAYLAEWDVRRGALTLHTTSNIPGVIRDVLAECLALPGNKIHVIAPDVGGSFGGKGSLYPEELLVCILARKLKRPIKYCSDRLEDLVATSQAFDEIVDAQLAVAADGALLGMTAEVLGDVGAYSIYPWTAALEPVQVISFLPGPYKMDNYRARVRGVVTPKAPTGPYRGVGRPASTFVTERLIDKAARALAIDPADMRRRNLVQPGEFPYRIASGIIWDEAAFVGCLEGALERGGYEGLKARREAARAEGRLLGIGLASYSELTGIGSRIAVAPGMPINTGTETAILTVDVTGAVTAAFGVSSHGQGLETTLAQVIADELGCRFEDVEVQHGDSALTPVSTGTYASRSAVLGGGAAILAARVVKTKVLKAAAFLMNVEPDDLDMSGGLIRARGSNASMTLKEVARAVYAEMGRIPLDRREDLTATETYDPYVGTPSPATHLAVVEVDPGTFGVTVLEYVVAEDCGRIINPLIVEGQVQGGVAQGIGAALLEEVVHDDAGQVLTASLADYLPPVASVLPDIAIVHLEDTPSKALGGFRGMGEGGTIGAPAAIANAITDALAPLGIEVDELPATPERLFRLAQRNGATNP
ncbi:MAG: xanthine dehydrogenase family protein molybdopterin-binding subunit, partial [Phenylobacterium sp.]